MKVATMSLKRKRTTRTMKRMRMMRMEMKRTRNQKRTQSKRIPRHQAHHHHARTHMFNSSTLSHQSVQRYPTRHTPSCSCSLQQSHQPSSPSPRPPHSSFKLSLLTSGLQQTLDSYLRTLFLGDYRHSRLSFSISLTIPDYSPAEPGDLKRTGKRHSGSPRSNWVNEHGQRES